MERYSRETGHSVQRVQADHQFINLKLIPFYFPCVFLNSPPTQSLTHRAGAISSGQLTYRPSSLLEGRGNENTHGETHVPQEEHANSKQSALEIRLDPGCWNYEAVALPGAPLYHLYY